MEPKDRLKATKNLSECVQGHKKGKGRKPKFTGVWHSVYHWCDSICFSWWDAVFICWYDFASFLFQDSASRQWSLCFRPFFLPRAFNRSCLCLFLRIAWPRQPQAQSWYESGQYNSELQVYKWRCSVQLYQRVSRYSTFSFCGLFCLKDLGWVGLRQGCPTFWCLWATLEEGELSWATQ